MQLIVHATDGSPEAAQALEVAMELARDTGAQLAVVSVHIIHPGGKGLSPPITEVEQSHGAEHLAETAVATARAAGIDARAYVATGEPAKEIIRVAEEIGADLIVVGSRGFGPVRGALFGSVSRAIVGRSKIPVTVVTQRSVREPSHA